MRGSEYESMLSQEPEIEVPQRTGIKFLPALKIGLVSYCLDASTRCLITREDYKFEGYSHVGYLESDALLK